MYDKGGYIYYRHNGGMIYKTIYHRDGLFGYTEPLGFDDLTSALEAYNSSQVDAGTLRVTLVCKQNTVGKLFVLELVIKALAVFFQYCSNNFSAQFIKIISHYKKIGYSINVLQKRARLVINPITFGNFSFLFNCTPRESDF